MQTCFCDGLSMKFFQDLLIFLQFCRSSSFSWRSIFSPIWGNRLIISSIILSWALTYFLYYLQYYLLFVIFLFRYTRVGLCLFLLLSSHFLFSNSRNLPFSDPLSLFLCKIEVSFRDLKSNFILL